MKYNKIYIINIIVVLLLVIIILNINNKNENLVLTESEQPNCNSELQTTMNEVQEIATLYSKNKNIAQYNNINISNNLQTSIFNAKNMKGIVVVWSGSIDNIPAGWGLCDGTIYKDLSGNSVQSPDLRSVSILGASSPGTPTNNVGPSAGNRGTPNYPGMWLTPKQVYEYGGLEQVTLAFTEMPAHNHQSDITFGPCSNANPDSTNSVILNDGNSCGPFATGSAGGNQAGVTQAHNNMPPYIGLAYIIKIW